MTKVIHAYNEDTIRAMAHQRWIDEGRPDGRSEIHWQWAMASLAASAANADTPVAPTAKAAPAAKTAPKVSPKTVKKTAAAKPSRARAAK
jgi:Protein of unknown function (DUF2934)